MKRKMLTLLLLLGLSAQMGVYSAPLRIARKVMEETIERAAQKSGVVLTPASRKTAEKALKAAIVQYGDDALLAVRKGGLETLLQGSKYGDEFWKICIKAPPEAARSLALHADELFPIVKRCGQDFLILEGKVPGLGAQTVKVFGDSAVKTFKDAPSSHITRMLGFAAKANKPENVQLLYKGYAQSSGKILDHLNWKHIMAGGLSAAAIIAAYKATGAVQTLAENNPELLADAISRSLTITGLVIILILCSSAAIWICKSRRFFRLFFQRKKEEDSSSSGTQDM